MTHDIATRDDIIAELSDQIIKANDVRLAQEKEIGRLRTLALEFEAEVERMRNHADHIEEESGWRDCMALQAEVERLRAHTWEQERAAIVAWLDEMITGYKEVEHSDCWPDDLLVEIKEDIVSGEHWPPEGKL